MTVDYAVVGCRKAWSYRMGLRVKPAMTATRAVHSAIVGRDAFAVLPPAKPALRAASRSEVQDIAPRPEGGTVKTAPDTRG